MILMLMLALLTPQDVIALAEKDIATLSETEGIRYLSLTNIDEKDREAYASIVSFVLNSVSKQRLITLPVFVDNEKTLLRFNIKDYSIVKTAYDSLGQNKVLTSTKLVKILNCDNPILNIDYFIIKSTKAPSYYQFLDVKDLEGFRKRVGFDAKLVKEIKGEQVAVITNGIVARNSQQIRRSPLMLGYMWDARENARSGRDYVRNLLSEEYDSIQVLASNFNGLLAYYVADSKGRPQEHLNMDVAYDRTIDDVVVRASRNCVFCHGAEGVISFKDDIRPLKQHFKILAHNKTHQERLDDLFGSDLPFKKDISAYQDALTKTTGMQPGEFQKKFIQVFKTYYADLTFKQAARELGRTEEDLKIVCKDSRDVYLLQLLLDGKITRTKFEDLIGER